MQEPLAFFVPIKSRPDMLTHFPLIYASFFILVLAYHKGFFPYAKSASGFVRRRTTTEFGNRTTKNRTKKTELAKKKSSEKFFFVTLKK